MISISNEWALELLMERVRYWEAENGEQWREYLREHYIPLLDECNAKLEPELIIDNLYHNDIVFVDLDEAECNRLLSQDKVGLIWEANDNVADDFSGVIEYIGKNFIVLNTHC